MSVHPQRVIISANGKTAQRAIQILHQYHSSVGLILYGGGIPPSWSDDADFLVLIPTRSTEIVQRTLQVVEAALDSQADSYMPFMSDPEGNQALSAILKATNMEFIGASPEKYRTILNRVGVRWAATDLGLEVVPTSEMIEDRADALYWLTRIPCPVVVRTLRSKSRRFFSQDDALKHHSDLIGCLKQPSQGIGRLCEKCFHLNKR